MIHSVFAFSALPTANHGWASRMEKPESIPYFQIKDLELDILAILLLQPLYPIAHYAAAGASRAISPLCAARRALAKRLASDSIARDILE